MNVLNMTELELYERGLEALLAKLGAAETTRFLQQCKPGTGDYTADRHKWLKDEPIDTIVDRLEQTRLKWREEERARARRFAASQSEMRAMTDTEIYEIGVQVLIDKLGVAGSIRFYLHHCKHGNHGDSTEARSQPHTPANRVSGTSVQQVPAATPTPWLQEAAGAAHPPASMADESERGIS